MQYLLHVFGILWLPRDVKAMKLHRWIPGAEEPSSLRQMLDSRTLRKEANSAAVAIVRDPDNQYDMVKRDYFAAIVNSKNLGFSASPTVTSTTAREKGNITYASASSSLDSTLLRTGKLVADDYRE